MAAGTILGTIGFVAGLWTNSGVYLLGGATILLSCFIVWLIRSVQRTADRIVTTTDDGPQQTQQLEGELKQEEIAAQLGCAVEAVQFTQLILSDIDWHAKNVNLDSATTHITAVGFCNLWCARARKTFGTSAAAMLRSWGITSSDDIGQIVYALVALGWIEASNNDSPADFNGLFTVDEYFGKAS